jgi:hypothetical protein
MTDPATLLALAERCEQAARPDYELDLAIWTSLVFLPGFRPSRTDYTASLEAAITLVPVGCEWLRKQEQCMTVYRVPADPKEWARHIDARGATPALALCSAALRARAASHD